jgi:hypothetical protein
MAAKYRATGTTPKKTIGCFWLFCLFQNNILVAQTHLGCYGGIDLGYGSVLLLKVSGSILSGVNLGGLI